MTIEDMAKLALAEVWQFGESDVAGLEGGALADFERDAAIIARHYRGLMDNHEAKMSAIDEAAKLAAEECDDHVVYEWPPIIARHYRKWVRELADEIERRCPYKGGVPASDMGFLATAKDAADLLRKALGGFGDIDTPRSKE